MTKNKKISDAKKIIKEEKEKIKLEKKNIREKRRSKFKKTKIGIVLFAILKLFTIKKENFSKRQMRGISLLSIFLGMIISFLIILISIGGINTFKFIHNNKRLLSTYSILMDNYYGEIDSDTLEENLINSMVDTTGDIYTDYKDTDEASEFDELLNGTYEGIGCTIIQEENQIRVYSVYVDTPASEAGLKVDDIILTVDGKNALELGSTELANYIKNEASKEITMTIKRGEEELEIKIKRETIDVPVVSGEVIEYNEKKIGYIAISIFSATSSKQFRSNLEALEKEGIDALIIDVRDNNGGYLEQVNEISSMLLPKGKIIYQIEGEKKNTIIKDKTKEKREYPIAMLVNGGSASGSEVLAAAIKESYNGIIVGETTYGKGTVQQVKKLKDGSMIKYTVENWLTPLGTWINKEGIEPTTEEILQNEYYQNPTKENDNQLQKALELVSNN